jgi:hypothetical protein
MLASVRIRSQSGWYWVADTAQAPCRPSYVTALAPSSPGQDCGTGHCQHGRRKSQCKVCSPKSSCKHGRRESGCKDCGTGRWALTRIVFFEEHIASGVQHANEGITQLQIHELRSCFVVRVNSQ